jgi:hypothetical protein
LTWFDASNLVGHAARHAEDVHPFWTHHGMVYLGSLQCKQ